MMESKVEVVLKRQVSITLVGEDVDKLYDILKAAQSADIKDRRLFGFGQRLMAEIDRQRLIVIDLDEQDRKEALRKLLDQYEESNVVDLTEVVPEKKEGGVHPDLDQSRVDLGVKSDKLKKVDSKG